jgi:polysaccharide export outer membrane protein
MIAVFVRPSAVVVLSVAMSLSLRAQEAQQAAPTPPPATAAAVTNGTPPASVVLPAGYVIGPDDILSIVFWRDKEMSGEVVVRPDGKISLPLLNDVQAAGYSPEQLRDELMKAASRFVADPNATVVVKAINSRKVFITGNVSKQGPYPLTSDMNVLQLIAVSGGLAEYADSKNIRIIRNEGGKTHYFKFNYKDVLQGKNPQQNILLKPGDTVIVP